MVMALLGLSFALSALYATSHQQAESRKSRADIIIIDSMKIFGDLEKAAVSFPHDKHTDALEKQGKDCKTCHQTKEDELIFKFQRSAEIDYDTSLDIYHTNCINCHEERASANLETGPVECGECHQLRPKVVADQGLIDFDSSMHARHIKAAEDKCESCHHSVDADNKKIPYVKGKEDSCRACHKEDVQGKVLSYKAASHQQCISCHESPKAKEKIENTFVANNKCAGCHDKELLAKITKLDKIPRRDRNQPDITFLKSFDKIGKQMMDPVIFNHQRHEDVSACGTCHHDTLKSCENCHTLNGVKEGDWVTLAQAMHKIGSERSCIGCHAQKQQAKDCVGCHALIEIESHVSEGQSCKSCHSVSIDQVRNDKASGKELLAQNYQTASPKETRIDWDQVTEEVVIDVISDQYQGVTFNHRQIVKKMMEKIQGDILATNFHQGKDLICESCHHNSPTVNSPPPKCISCHAHSEDDQEGSIPGMKAAYHRQCFECHEVMGIEKPHSEDCVACHKEK